MSKPTELNTFINKWVQAHRKDKTQSWIAKELGMTRQAVSNRSIYLRGRGVELPKLNKAYDVAEINIAIGKTSKVERFYKRIKEITNA